jgi:putative redox protein
MSMTAIAYPVPEGLRQLIDVSGRHTLTTDEPERLGGTDDAPTPHELLPAALAACISTMITMYARPRDLDIMGLSVAVAYDPEAGFIVDEEFLADGESEPLLAQVAGGE